MNTKEIQTQLRPILEQIRKETFLPDYQAGITDENLMGLLASKFFQWDGQKVLMAAQHGLEDSNFHSEVKKIGQVFPWAELK